MHPDDLIFPLLALALIAGLILVGNLALRRRSPARPGLILDGSNVMYWRDQTPDIGTVFLVAQYLETRGFAVAVVFDANAGYLLGGRYQHDAALARQMHLSPKRVMVVPKGTPADPVILDAARDTGARIVSNDRYRDWADVYPEVRQPGFLIPGGYDDKGPWVVLPEDQG